LRIESIARYRPRLGDRLRT